MTASTFSARIARIDTAGDDSFIPRLVFGVLEDAALHPEGPFAIAAMAVLAFGRFKVAQVLKH